MLLGEVFLEYQIHSQRFNDQVNDRFLHIHDLIAQRSTNHPPRSARPTSTTFILKKVFIIIDAANRGMGISLT